MFYFNIIPMSSQSFSHKSPMTFFRCGFTAQQTAFFPRTSACLMNLEHSFHPLILQTELRICSNSYHLDTWIVSHPSGLTFSNDDIRNRGVQKGRRINHPFGKSSKLALRIQSDIQQAFYMIFVQQVKELFCRFFGKSYCVQFHEFTPLQHNP